MSNLEIAAGLIVSFKIFENGTTVEEQIWIRLLEILLSLGISLQSMLQFCGTLVVNKEVSEMSVAEHIPALRIRKVH